MHVPERVDRYQFGPGYQTTVGTVKLLAELVREQHLDPRIRARATEIVAGVPSMDVDGEIRAVWQFILDNVRYQRDPLGAEHITTPVELDHLVDQGLAAEDCESIELYASTLLAALGIPSEFEIQGRRPERPSRFTHCSLQVYNPRSKTWTSFDPVGYWEYEGFDLGDTLHAPGEPLERWSLAGERVQGGMLGALWGETFGDLGDAADLQKAKAVGTPIADTAIASGNIYGMAVGGLFKAGTGIADYVASSSTPQKGQAFGPQPLSARRKPGAHPEFRMKEMTTLVRDEEKSSSLSRGLLIGGGILLATKLLGVW